MLQHCFRDTQLRSVTMCLRVTVLNCMESDWYEVCLSMSLPVSVSGSSMMELDQLRDKALTYQSVLKYLEPRVEMRLLWRSCCNMGHSYIHNISTTIK